MNFYLTDKRADNTAIYATVSYPCRWKYYLGLSVSPRHWDFARQRVKYNHPNHIRFNRVLDTVQNKASFQTYVSKLLKSDHIKVASKMWQNKKGYLKAV